MVEYRAWVGGSMPGPREIIPLVARDLTTRRVRIDRTALLLRRAFAPPLARPRLTWLIVVCRRRRIVGYRLMSRRLVLASPRLTLPAAAASVDSK
jgi:hypothetical protein